MHEASSFLCNENPRFERGFRKTYSYESFTLCRNKARSSNRKTSKGEKTNGQKYFSTCNVEL